MILDHSLEIFFWHLTNWTFKKWSKKCKNWTFKVNFLGQKMSKSFHFVFIGKYRFRTTFLTSISELFCFLKMGPNFFNYMEIQFSRYQDNISQEWFRVKKFICYLCSLKHLPHKFANGIDSTSLHCLSFMKLTPN